MLQSIMRTRFTTSLPMLLAVGTIRIGVASTSFSQTAHVSSSDLPNFATVDPGIYRGAAPTPAGLQRLKSMGVRTVIDLRISPKLVKTEEGRVHSLGMNYVNIPLGSEPATPKQQQQFLSLAGQSSSSNPIYVHCQHGADRTGEMIGLYRRVDDHWPYAKTYAEMRSFGFKSYYPQLAAVVKKASPSHESGGR